MDFTRELRYRLPLVRGEDVRAVQQALITLKVQPPCGTADGVFGPATQEAVKNFQHGFNVAGPQDGTTLSEDGIVGEKTWAALFNRAANTQASAAHIKSANAVISATPPPLNKGQVGRAKTWLMAHFNERIAATAQSSPLDVDLICAIICKETASEWLGWIEHMAPEQVLARCVFDASGDAPGTSRSAFPKNTAAFRERYGDALTEELINEANETRKLRNFSPKDWVYKGYGIFQYDLQNIVNDEAFFRDKLWGSFDDCTDRFMRLMQTKLQASGRNVREAVRRYNGSGPRAEEYAAHVMLMREWSAEQSVPG